ncbi:MAG: PilZ domain-containing protein [Phycisphaerae bacterium]|nr:PilZ domain-containing protein [Phycisphaerae bacterium]
MRVWTNASFRALDLLAGPEPSAEAIPGADVVDRLLDLAAAAGAPCSLTRTGPGQRRLPMEAPILGLEGRSITIGRPAYKPGQRLLAVGEDLDLRIGVEGASYLGRTTVVARYAPEGETSKRMTYGLARPEVLLVDDRRSSERFGLAYARPPQAELLCAPRHKPLGAGSIVDLSAGGMRIRARDANVRAGDRVVVRAKLADDVLVHAIGAVVYAGPRPDGTADVGVRFQAMQPEIDRFIRGVAADSADARSALQPKSS